MENLSWVMGNGRTVWSVEHRFSEFKRAHSHHGMGKQVVLLSVNNMSDGNSLDTSLEVVVLHCKWDGDPKTNLSVK